MSKRGMMVIGAPVLSDLGTLVAGSEEPLRPISNLADNEPSNTGRFLTASPGSTQLEQTTTDGYQIDGVFLGNHNLSPYATYRITTSDTGIAPAYLAPDGEPIAVIGGTGGYADVDDADPDVPDGNFIVANAGTLITWFDFPTPASALALGADLQCFVVYVENDDPGGALEMNAGLYESLALKQNLDSKVIGSTESGGQYLIFPWDATDLVSAAGAGVQLTLTVSSTASTYNFKIGVVGWYAVTAADVAALSYDSGWVDVFVSGNDALWGGTSPLDVAPDPHQKIDHPIPAAYLASDVKTTRLYLRDDRSPAAVDPTVAASVDFIDAGIFRAGPSFIPNMDKTEGWVLEAVTETRMSTTTGGKAYSTEAFKRRKISCSLPALSKSEALSLFDRLDWRSGLQTGFVVIMEPDATAEERHHTSLFVTLASLSPVVYRGGTVDKSASDTTKEHRVSKNFTFIEKL